MSSEMKATFFASAQEVSKKGNHNLFQKSLALSTQPLYLPNLFYFPLENKKKLFFKQCYGTKLRKKMTFYAGNNVIIRAVAFDLK